MPIGALALSACTFNFGVFRERDGGTNPTDVQEDIGRDVRPDVGTDAAIDVAVETGADVRDDVVADTGMDAGMDVQPDVAPDVPMDVRPDVAPDVPIDVLVDVPVDVPVDMGAPDTTVVVDGGCVARLVVNELQAAGTTAADEFVEIYNAGDCEVPLLGWTIRYSSSTGSAPSTRWTGTSVDTLAPGAFAVIGGVDFAGTVIGRFAGATGVLAGGGGGVGLYAPGDLLQDGVAYLSAVSTHPFVEPRGGAPAPNPGTSMSISRRPNGTDTNSTVADFTVGTPTPNAPNM